MCSRRPAHHSARRGQTLPMFAVALVAVLGLAALALDGSRIYAEQERVQRAADAAAIAAAHELRRGNADYSADLLPAAIHDAALQGVSADDAEVILHYPPVSGTFADSPDHVEVAIRVELPTTFMGMFGKSRQAVAGRAVAGLASGDQPCLAALAASGSGVITVEGEQPLTIDCPVAAASSDLGAFAAGEALDGPAPAVGGQDSLGDLVSGLRMPTCAGRSPGTAETAKDGTALYWPGCHEKAVAIRSGHAQFMPGVHVFERGLAITSGVVVGRNVAFLFPASPEQTGVEIRAAAAVELTAPVGGEMRDILMFSNAAGGAALERSAGSVLQGGLLFPAADLRWAPNAPDSGAWVRVVADRISILESPDGRAVTAPPAETSTNMVAVLVE